VHNRAGRTGRPGDAGAVAGGQGRARGRVRGCAAQAGRRGPPSAGSHRRPAAERCVMISSATSLQRQAALVTGAATGIGKAIAAPLADHQAADAARPGRGDRRTGARRRPGVTKACPAGAASSAQGWRRPDSILAAAAGVLEVPRGGGPGAGETRRGRRAPGTVATLWASGSCSAPPVHYDGGYSWISPSCRGTLERLPGADPCAAQLRRNSRAGRKGTIWHVPNSCGRGRYSPRTRRVAR